MILGYFDDKSSTGDGIFCDLKQHKLKEVNRQSGATCLVLFLSKEVTEGRGQNSDNA